MAAQYAWKCPQCKGDIQLSTTQAGQQLPCPACDTLLTLPKLGFIKSLPVIGGVETSQRPAKSGSVPLKSWLFAGGLLIAVLGLVAGLAAQYRANQYHVEVDLDAELEHQYELIDEYPADQLYALAVASTDESFALEYREPDYRTRNIKSGIIEKVAWVCWGLATMGVLMLLSSFAFRSS